MAGEREGAQFRLRFYSQHGMEEKLARRPPSDGMSAISAVPLNGQPGAGQSAGRDQGNSRWAEAGAEYESAHNQEDIDDYCAGYDRSRPTSVPWTPS